MANENQYDAIVIGAGVIGAAIGYELSKLGRRTLNIDKLPAAGYGSTSNTCAIIRFSYSTYDGVAMAWEGQHYWVNWRDYLGGDVDERGLIDFIQCGTALLKKSGGHSHHEKVVPLLTELDIPFEDWSLDTLLQRLPALNGSVFGMWPIARKSPSVGNSERSPVFVSSIITAETPVSSSPMTSTTCENHFTLTFGLFSARSCMIFEARNSPRR